MTGLDLIREIRTFSSTPAIALTGFGMEEDMARTAEAGFNAHLTKPVNLARLRAVMEQVTSE
jgi:CheY-like chemotaxis protein